MRIITIMLGILFSAVGIYLISNGGLTFISVAFIVGLVFTVGGVIECLSYSSYRGENATNSWILVDGTSTFMLGVLILMNKLSADVAVPLVLGLWILYSGIRNFVHAWDQIDNRKAGFLDHLLIGLLNIVLGLYAFFDQDLFDLSTITLVGIYMLAGGVNIMHVGTTIVLRKPEFLKTKEEKLEEAEAKRAEAHEAAREAIRIFKETQAVLKRIEETPAASMDPTLAPKPSWQDTQLLAPGTEETGQSQEGEQTSAEEPQVPVENVSAAKAEEPVTDAKTADDSAAASKAATKDAATESQTPAGDVASTEASDDSAPVEKTVQPAEESQTPAEDVPAEKPKTSAKGKTGKNTKKSAKNGKQAGKGASKPPAGDAVAAEAEEPVTEVKPSDDSAVASKAATQDAAVESQIPAGDVASTKESDDSAPVEKAVQPAEKSHTPAEDAPVEKSQGA